MTEKTKVQRAIERIFTKPGTRSSDLAEMFGCQVKDVPAYMKDVIRSGLVVTCKVERPGQQAVYEYKPSATAPDIAPDFKEWRKDHLPTTPEKPLTFKVTGPREGTQKKGSDMSETPAGGGEITPAAASVQSPSGKHDLLVGEAVIQAQAGSHGPEEAKASASDPAASASPSGIIAPENDRHPYIAELIEHPSYSIKVGATELAGFTKASTWNGMTELRNAIGQKLIIAEEEETPFSRTIKAMLPIGRKPANPKATIITGTPALLKQLFPDLFKAA